MDDQLFDTKTVVKNFQNSKVKTKPKKKIENPTQIGFESESCHSLISGFSRLTCGMLDTPLAESVMMSHKGMDMLGNSRTWTSRESQKNNTKISRDEEGWIDYNKLTAQGVKSNEKLSKSNADKTAQESAKEYLENSKKRKNKGEVESD